MHFATGTLSSSYEPTTIDDTSNLHYWLNWRFLLCAIWVLSCMILASVLIWKYNTRHGLQSWATHPGIIVYIDECWKPCLKDIHPAWLMVFRIIAFAVLLALLIINAIVDGSRICYFYTQWTFTLVTIYFALGSLLSIYGCHQYLQKSGGDLVRLDRERQSYTMSANGDSANVIGTLKHSGTGEVTRQVAGFWGYAFQIIYQTNAGAVLLTDCVFWFIFVPYLATHDYSLNYLLVGMHSINAVFILGDMALNSLHFPWFRIAYFLLWTSVYVIFQWVIHACISIWWPYPFLDLSSNNAPLWYLLIALMHIPCFAVFGLIVKMKKSLLLRWFPESLYRDE